MGRCPAPVGLSLDPERSTAAPICPFRRLTAPRRVTYSVFDTSAAFIDAWMKESKATERILACLTDSKLAFRPSGFGRSLGALAWHIVTALREIGDRAGIETNGPGRDTPVPELAADILSTYVAVAGRIAVGCRALRDEDMAAEVDVYGESWSRGRTLYVLVAHEIHHRGQLTVLLRLADLEVVDTYGPAGPPPDK